MDNYEIADQFSLLSKLMDIHGDNSFKAKSYAVAAFTIEKLPEQLTSIPAQKIFSIKGIGESVGKKIIELIETNELGVLKEYLEKTPKGVLEMLQIKGIGPKKIATIWKELEIETLGELLYACNENRLLLYKGFGEKTQKNIKDAIEFYFNNIGSYLYQQVEQIVDIFQHQLQKNFPDCFFDISGEYKRQLEIIEKLEWVTNANASVLKNFFEKNDYKLVAEQAAYISFKGKENLTIGFYLATNNRYKVLFTTSSSEDFLQAWNKKFGEIEPTVTSEEIIFSAHQLPFIPAYLRESTSILEKATTNSIAHIIQPKDIKGIIHSHSNWSDGVNSIEEMANACIERQLEYLVISDHSKAAFYANGLSEERITQQHALIESLNKRLAPFTIYKSIECDILNDGSLDYDDEVLASFDLVIASIHSNLKMNEEKAMTRLIKAIENPFTSILGHMTGRLLLSRNGYPVDHKKVIDACAANNVVIELNAHPRRLDIDWRWIDYALTKNVLISIDPDAHAIEGFADCKYGVLVAQKAGLTITNNLSSFSKKEFEAFLIQQHHKRN